MTGTGQSPVAQITLSMETLSFQPQKVGSHSVAQYVTIMSSGMAVLTISGVSLAGANPGDFDVTDYAGTCSSSGMSLSLGQRCILRVHFDPTALGGRSASLVIGDNASGSPQSVVLTGTGD